MIQGNPENEMITIRRLRRWERTSRWLQGFGGLLILAFGTWLGLLVHEQVSMTQHVTEDVLWGAPISLMWVYQGMALCVLAVFRSRTERALDILESLANRIIHESKDNAHGLDSGTNS